VAVAHPDPVRLRAAPPRRCRITEVRGPGTTAARVRLPPSAPGFPLRRPAAGRLSHKGETLVRLQPQGPPEGLVHAAGPPASKAGRLLAGPWGCDSPSLLHGRDADSQLAAPGR